MITSPVTATIIAILVCLQITFGVSAIAFLCEGVGREDFWESQFLLWTPAQIYKYNGKVNWFGAYFLAFLLLIFNTIPYLIRILCYLCCAGRKD